MSRIFAVAGLAVCLSGGCGSSPGRHGASTQTDIQPASLEFKEAILVLAGTELPVKVETKRNGTAYSINLMSFGETLEREIYEVDEKHFAIAQLLQERYMPVLPVLDFPLTPGSERTWEGALQSAGISRPSKAMIVTQWKRYKLFGKDVDSVQVDVKLSIESGAPNPAIRDLNFVFVPQKGLVERAFGKELRRIPPKDAMMQ